MSVINTAESVNGILEKQKATYEGRYVLSESAYKKLLHLCFLCDTLAAEFSATISFGSNPTSMYSVLSAESDDLVFEYGRTHLFFTLIQDADYLGFQKAKSGLLQMQMGVKNLWVKP